MPVTGQEVIAPHVLKNLKPSYVFITNPLYEAEISKMLKSLSLRSKIISIH
ncbi:hypothetical protein HQ585_12345 [candidate division KSB1 bacterium]|nr:hypothetical protein [candidate division KSB1 bacterium]